MNNVIQGKFRKPVASSEVGLALENLAAMKKAADDLIESLLSTRLASREEYRELFGRDLVAKR